MGTVKYTGPVASFHCPTEATIRSLKVHFSPKQEGSGDPSPENVREIEGYSNINIYRHGINMFNPNVATTVQPADKIVEPFKYVLGAWYRGGWSYYFTERITNFSIKETGISFICDDSRYGIAYLLPIKGGSTIQCTYRKFTEGNETTGRGILFVYLDEKQQYITLQDCSSGSIITVPDTASYIKISFAATANVITEYSDILISLTDNTTETSYKPYRGETIDYEFGVLGKNKFDNLQSPFKSGQYVLYDSTVGKEPVYTTNANYNVYSIPIIKNTTYTISGIKADNPCSGLIDNQGIFTYVRRNNGSTGGTSWSITTGESDEYLLLSVAINGTYKCDDILQLELGSTATTYEPYNPNKTVYGGWVDLVSGEVQQEWTHVIIDENTLFYMATRQNNSGNYFYKEFNNEPDKQCLYTAGKLSKSMRVEKSNQFEIQNSWGEASINQFSAWAYANADTKTTIRFGFPSELNITSVDAAKSWFIENGSLEIIYPLVAQVSYSLAPISMQTFLAQNNVWSNADYVEVEYDLYETQDILARKQFIIANQPHIEKLAAAPLQSFTTDMAAPLKECKVHFEPVQEGTGDPSPENIRPISGWTGVEVYTAGENLIPIDYEAVEGKWKPTNGVISGSVYNMGQFPVPATMLRYQVETTGNPYFGFIDGPIQLDEPVYGVKVVTNVRSTNFDNSDGHKYALITQNREGNYDKKIIISVGGSDKIYSEPSGTTFSLDWADSAGTVYGGYVDLVTGEVWAEWKYIDFTTANWTQFSVGTSVITTSLFPGTISSRNNGFCNILPMVSNPNVYGIEGIDWNNGRLNLCLSISRGITTLADFKAWLQTLKDSGTTPCVVAKYGEPVLLTTLTPTPLKTLRGTNNIWSNAGNIELSYWKH